MKWISALDLQQWADRIGARTAFPALIRDLITASASDISDVRFPSGDKGQVRGFDGWLDAAGAPPYVPAGRSVWEFGVSDNPTKKFKEDYETRVEEIAEKDRKQLSFVFASPRSWDNPKEKLPDFVKKYSERWRFLARPLYRRRRDRGLDSSLRSSWCAVCSRGARPGASERGTQHR